MPDWLVEQGFAKDSFAYTYRSTEDKQHVKALRSQMREAINQCSSEDQYTPEQFLKNIHVKDEKTHQRLFGSVYELLHRTKGDRHYPKTWTDRVHVVAHGLQIALQEHRDVLLLYLLQQMFEWDLVRSTWLLEHGHLELLRVYEQTTYSNFDLWTSAAIWSNQFHILEYLYETHWKDALVYDEKYEREYDQGASVVYDGVLDDYIDRIGDAAESGCFQMVMYLLESAFWNDWPLHGTQKEQEWTEALNGAIVGEHLSIVCYLIPFGVRPNETSFAAAAEHNAWEVLHYLEDITQPLPLDCPLVVESAALSGNVHMLTYLIERQGYVCSPKAIDNLAAEGHLDQLEWLVNKGYMGTSEAIDRAAANNHLSCIRFLCTQKYKGTTEAVNNAVCFGYVDCLELLLGTGHRGTLEGLKDAAGRGHIECLERLLATDHEFSPEIVQSAAINGKKDALIYLLEECDYPCPPVVEVCLRSSEIVAYLRQLPHPPEIHWRH